MDKTSVKIRQKDDAQNSKRHLFKIELNVKSRNDSIQAD